MQINLKNIDMTEQLHFLFIKQSSLCTINMGGQNGEENFISWRIRGNC